MIFAWVQNELNLHKLKSVCKPNNKGRERVSGFSPFNLHIIFLFPSDFLGIFPWHFLCQSTVLIRVLFLGNRFGISPPEMPFAALPLLAAIFG